MPLVVQFHRVESVPLAVIRRQARASELSRLVPQGCGLVWNEVRAQQAKAGRHVALDWDGSIRLEVGVELHGRLPNAVRLCVRRRPPAPSRRRLISGPMAGLARRMAPFASGAAPTTTTLPVRTGRFTGTGCPSGIRIRQRFARTFITSWLTENVRVGLRGRLTLSLAPNDPSAATCEMISGTAKFVDL